MPQEARTVFLEQVFLQGSLASPGLGKLSAVESFGGEGCWNLRAFKSLQEPIPA